MDWQLVHPARSKAELREVQSWARDDEAGPLYGGRGFFVSDRAERSSSEQADTRASGQVAAMRVEAPLLRDSRSYGNPDRCLL